jgi:hypothetical protein
MGKVNEHNEAVRTKDWKFFAGKNKMAAVRLCMDALGVGIREATMAVNEYLEKRT